MADKNNAEDGGRAGRHAQRSVPADPRLLAATAPTSPLSLAGKIAGWAGLVLLLVSMFWTGISRTFSARPKIILVFGIVAIAFWFATNVGAVVAQVRTRGFRAVLNSVLFTVFIIGIISMANYVAGRHHMFRGDWSEAKLSSLAPGSIKILKSLQDKVDINAFISPDYYNGDYLCNLLREYEMSSAKITLHIYDPMLDLEKVEKYDRPYDGTVFVEAGDRREKVQGGTEEQISSAILAVTTGEKTKVYFLTGHNEQSIDAMGEMGVSVLKEYLSNEQYQVETLALATEKEPKVPSDCAVLSIIGAKQPLLEKEKTALSKYVEQGGNLFMALATPPAPDFAFLLQQYGVRPLKGVVIDPGRALQGNPQVPVVLRHGSHEIVKSLSMVALPTTIAFEVETPEPPMPTPGAPPPPTSPALSILESSGAAWLETSTEGAVEKDPDERSGPLTMAVAIDLSGEEQRRPQFPGAPPMPEDNVRKARIVAVGDCDFVRDDLYQLGLRSNIFLATSAIAWLTKNEKLVTIPPQEPPDRSMPLVTAQKNLAIVISAVIIPLLVLVVGMGVWWRRRGS